MMPGTGLNRRVLTPLWATISPIMFALAGLAACQSPGTSSGHVATDAGQADAGVMPTDAGPAPTDAGSTTTPDGGAVDAGLPVMTIISVTPPRGPATGGTVVVILGTGFITGVAEEGGPQASAATNVFFGPNMADLSTLQVVDDSTIEVTVPPGTLGPATLNITHPSLGNSVSCTTCWTYTGVIELNSISAPTPPVGPTSGGTAFTLSGTGFAPGQIVLFGTGEATDLVFTNGTTITGVTPPGTEGSANVGVISADASSFLDRGWVYLTPLQLTAVSPASSPLAGGATATITGTGFSADATVSFGTMPAQTTFVSATELTAVVPAATTVGAVAVSVAEQRGTASLANGFAYFTASDSLQIFSVSPQQGPVAGGTMITLTGSGFSGAGFQAEVGLNLVTSVTPGVPADNVITFLLPPAAGPGVVDIQARSAQGGADLPMSFAYVEPLTVTAISPDTGSASGTPAVTATLTGTGFSATCTVYIGAKAAAVQSAGAGGTTLVVTVPEGSTGPQDVRVTCGTAGTLSYQQATLPGGFTFTSPLSVLQVNADSGAIAGNTQVTVYGDGFVQGMQVLFGGVPASPVTVQTPNIAVVNTPPGNVGFVDVEAKLPSGQTATLVAGFGYFNPSNSSGGATGGPMLGILNVTVIDDTPGLYGQPVAGATITINDGPLVGTTDSKGQVTFSDPSLLKPVDITGTKVNYGPQTLARINARNVTFFMGLTSGGSGSGSGPMPMPPATFSGRVCGFKLPPGVLTAGVTAEAQVFFTAPYVYAAPPFAQPATPVIIGTDCGSYQFTTSNFGPTAMYAVFGTVNAGVFTPYLMGIIRNLTAEPGVNTTNPDIVLSIALDLTIPITVELVPTGNTVTNNVYSYMDLGAEGVIPLAQTTANTNSFTFTNHPHVDGQGLVFLNEAWQEDAMGNMTYPISFCYQRQDGAVASGVTIGPMLAFTHLETPMTNGVFAGSLGWTFGAGPQASLIQVEVDQQGGGPVWDVILPGGEVGVTMPQSVQAQLPTRDPSTPNVPVSMSWTVITAVTPGFNYDYISFQQLGLNAWTSFTEDFSTFTLP